MIEYRSGAGSFHENRSAPVDTPVESRLSGHERYIKQQKEMATRAFQMLRDDKDLGQLDRDALINALNAEYSYLALRDIKDLTPGEKHTLIRKTDAEYAYLTIRDIKDLTPDERHTPTEKIDVGYAYIPLLEIDDQTAEERQKLKTILIAKANGRYAYLALHDIKDLTMIHPH